MGAKAGLTEKFLSDKLSDMKRVTAGQFQKEFGRILQSMKEGQAVEITRRGKPVGQFTKRGKPIKVPDFLSLLEKSGYSIKTGNRILKEFHDSLG